MSKYVHDDLRDLLLNGIKTTADKLICCEGQPASYAAAIATKGTGGNSLGQQAVASGDFTLANDGGGRKLTVAAFANIAVTDNGDWDHVACVDDGANKLLFVTTKTLQAVVAGNKMDTAAFKLSLPAAT